MKEKISCKTCKQTFEIDPDVPLNKQVSGHTWSGNHLRCLEYEDYLEEQADREICYVCGVAHGSNPYTGCEQK